MSDDREVLIKVATATKTSTKTARQDSAKNGAYSYGDSAGITPDFPFNPPPGGTKTGTNLQARSSCSNYYFDLLPLSFQYTFNALTQRYL